MPLCPQITNTPVTVTQTADFTVSSVVPVIASTSDGVAQNIIDVETTVDGKNKIFRQTSAPTATATGDIWFDTDDGNKQYYWTGTAWVSVQDLAIQTAQTTADGKNKIFRSATSPTATAVGDTWFDTSAGNKLYYWNGTAWISVQDAAIATAQTTADGKNKIFRSATAPTATAVGDSWFDTSAGNKLYYWNGTSWISVQDTAIATAQATADSKIKTFYQTSAPTATGAGDVWFDTDDGNKQYRWSGTAWVSVQDAAIATAQSAANAAASAASAAQTTADGKNKVFRQTSAPTASAVGDLWFDTDDDNRVYRWDGTSWVTNQFGTNALANFSANKITTGTLDASVVTVSNINAGNISTGTLSADRIAAASITGAKIAAATISASNIVSGTITASEIAAATITGSKIAAGTITADNIAANTITASKIAAGTITSTEIATGTITASNIASGAITASKIAAGTITSTEIATGTITASNIAAATITGDRLVANTITATQIAAGTITASEIAASTITGAKIAAGTITASNIAASTITATQINSLNGATIGGWTISSTQLSIPGAGNYIDASGVAVFSSISTNSGTTNTFGATVSIVGGITASSTANLNGSVFMPNISSSANAANMRWGTAGGGQVFYSTASSARFKTDIVNLLDVDELNPKLLLQLPVRAFRYKDDYLEATDDRSGVLVPGFIAEEVDQVYPIAADYEEDGPNNWNEKFMIPALLALVQDLYKEIAILKGE